MTLPLAEELGLRIVVMRIASDCWEHFIRLSGKILTLLIRHRPRYYNLRSSKVVPDFRQNEVVMWRKNFRQSDAAANYAASLGPKYVRCRVKAKIGSTTYELEDLSGKSIGKYHVQDLKPDLGVCPQN
jgi:hypothetical protein